MKKIYFLISFFLITSLCYSQNEASNWYFGFGAGLQFNTVSGATNSLNDGLLVTNEGCASISDDNGDLLFYTDGTTVWNRNHEIMPNGSGLFGDASSTQSAIIVQNPGVPTIYYVFTVDNALDGSNFGLNYSVVNMFINRGLGDVTFKNTNLLPLCSEKISAVLKDCNDQSIWVITFATEDGGSGPNNTYHAFEVNEFGVNPISVKSKFNINVTDGRGYLKLSPNGKRLASANMRNGLYLYDFDTVTGIVSNQQSLSINSRSNFPYGIEFSPNSQLLYVHSSNDFGGLSGNSPELHFSSLTQFDLSSPLIQSTEFELDSRSLYRGGLQLGPNGKIYRALSATYTVGLPYLGVIHNPNNVGGFSNYQHNAVNLSPNESSQGLPPFVQSLFSPKIDIIQNGSSSSNLFLCKDDLYTLAAEEILDATYTWYLDGNELSENDFDLEITQAGLYEVIIDLNNNNCPIEGEAVVAYFDKPEVHNSALVQCDVDGILDERTLFDLTQANEELTGGAEDVSTKFFLSFNDAQNDDFEIDGTAFNNTSNPQTIYVRVTHNDAGCFDFAELTISTSSTESNDAVLSLCDNDGLEDGFIEFNLIDANIDILNGLPSGLTVNYYETLEDTVLEENTLEATFINTIPYNQTIYARVENANNCYGISEVALTVYELPDINTELLTYYCLNTFPQTIPLDADVIDNMPENYTYSWSTGEVTYEINVNAHGNYNVTVINTHGCSKERTITVESSNTATFESIRVVDATQNNTITILVSGEGIYEYALLNNDDGLQTPFQSNHIFENVFPGIYTVLVKDVKNDCGTVQDQVSVIGFPKFFTPNNDGRNDTWQVFGLSSQFQPNSKVLIFNRYGKLIKQISPTSSGWDGTFNGNMLPNDDYWFSVTLQDGRAFKNHFTLKR